MDFGPLATEVHSAVDVVLRQLYAERRLSIIEKCDVAKGLANALSDVIRDLSKNTDVPGDIVDVLLHDLEMVVRDLKEDHVGNAERDW